MRDAAGEGDFETVCDVMSERLREQVAVDEEDCPSVLGAGDPFTRLVLQVDAVQEIERVENDELDGVGETATATLRGGGSVSLLGILQFGGGIRWEIDGVNP